MKAVDYYNRFAEDVYTEWKETGKTEKLRELLQAFVDEFNEIRDARMVRSDRAVVSLVREFNQKWNKLVRIFEQEYTESPIKENGFWAFMESVIPELKKFGVRG